MGTARVALGHQLVVWITIKKEALPLVQRRPNFVVYAEENSNSPENDEEFEARLARLREAGGRTAYGKSRKDGEQNSTGASKSAAEPRKAYDFSSEILHFESPPHRGDLAVNLALGTTLLWLPLTAAAVSRAAFMKFRFTDLRVSVITTAPWQKEQLDAPYQEVKDVVTVPRGLGAWGDMVITLRNGNKLELRSLPRFKEMKEYILARRDALSASGRDREENWERVWVCVKGSAVLLFNSEEDREPRVILPAGKGFLAEPTLEAGPPVEQRHKRGLRLRLNVKSKEGSPTERDAQPEGAAALDSPAEHLFAAESEDEHNKWRSTMLRATRSLSSSQEDTVVRAVNGKGINASSFAPSPLVVSRLCSPGRDKGQEVLKRFHSTRCTFEEGLRNLGAVREEAQNVKQEISQLHILLADMQQAVANHHTPNDLVEDGQALRECKEWLDTAIAFVMELDHEREELLHREPATGAYLASDWHTFAQNAIMSLKDVEEAMQMGQLVEARHQQLLAKGCAEAACGPLSKLRCYSAPRSRMPYNTYWARKIAI
ncbi:hypothetical protein WJX72_009632 [[Myrmecia] bisecta]|uniref:YdbS-like PH domain-containing protein n=1 Tax=[Myrmecia] bisecta TaxID=41462 RepID=A0AAW1PYI9_9CHLO